MVLCETHAVCALVERHRVGKRDWQFSNVLRLLNALPQTFVGELRRVLAEEYDRADLFHSDVVYHPAYKLLLVTMVGLGKHDVNVCRFFRKLKEPIPRTPSYRVRVVEQKVKVLSRDQEDLVDCDEDDPAVVVARSHRSTDLDEEEEDLEEDDVGVVSQEDLEELADEEEEGCDEEDDDDSSADGFEGKTGADGSSEEVSQRTLTPPQHGRRLETPSTTFEKPRGSLLRAVPTTVGTTALQTEAMPHFRAFVKVPFELPPQETTEVPRKKKKATNNPMYELNHLQRFRAPDLFCNAPYPVVHCFPPPLANERSIT